MGVGHRFDSATSGPRADRASRRDVVDHLAAPPMVPAACRAQLSGVAARTASDAWAVGSFTTREQPRPDARSSTGTGPSWTRVKSPNAGQPAGGELSGVAALAADDVWAVGGSGQGAPGRERSSSTGTARRGRSSRARTRVRSRTRCRPSTAIAPDDVWAVGTWFTKAFDDRTLTLHWDGTSWSACPSPNAGPASAANDLVSVSANATDDVWAVGLARAAHAHDALGRHVVVGRPQPDAGWSRRPGRGRRGRPRRRLGGREAVVDRQVNAGRTLVEHWDGTGWIGRGEREQGPERQPPVGDLGGDRPHAGRRRSIHRRRHGSAGAALPGALRPLTPRAVRVGAGSYNRSVPPFRITVRLQARRRPAGGHHASSPRASRPGSRHLTLLGATGTGKTFTIAHVVEADPAPDPGDRAQQVAGRPAGQRVPRGLPRQRGRVLRQLLRLLPARGVHPAPPTRTSRRTRR